MFSLAGKTVAIIGTARSGLAAARLVLHLQGTLRVSEQKNAEDIPDDVQRWVRQYTAAAEWGGHTRPFITASDLVVISPGVRIDAPVCQWAREAGIPVIGEVELASRVCPCPIIAVTGSNGKTTVAHLITRIIEQSAKTVRLCGNVGFPFSSCVLDLQGVDYVVLEVSSFQLETMIDFRPRVAVFLNFSENHLDRHHDIDEYFNAKKRIFMNQTAADHAVLNQNDARVAALAPELKAQVVFFGPPQDRPAGNPNFWAAQAVARILGIAPAVCEAVFGAFAGVEHRLEKVRTLEGIDFINDSKATTAEAGRWAIQSIGQPVILICGGRDKNIDFSGLKGLVRQKVKGMLVLGEARSKLSGTFRGDTDIQECDGLAQAVRKAREMAQPGDCVLLSPMCASFDMFKDFEERGRVFKDLVRELT